MAQTISPGSVLRLYKQLMRQGEQFVSFNYRMYCRRRVRDYFKEMKSLQDAGKMAGQYQFGLQSLEMLKRQTAIGRMYQTTKLVIEDPHQSGNM